MMDFMSLPRLNTLAIHRKHRINWELELAELPLVKPIFWADLDMVRHQPVLLRRSRLGLKKEEPFEGTKTQGVFGHFPLLVFPL